MNRLADDEIIESLTEHPFSTPQQIKSTRIIKNHTSLTKHLNLLEGQNRVKRLEFFNRYYVNFLPERFIIFGEIWECAEKITLQLKKNYNLRRGSFYREFKRAYKKYDSYTGTKVSKTKRVVKDLSEKTDNIKKSNERCLLKWFLLFVQKAIIWELEFRKLKQSPFATFDDQKLIYSMLAPMIFLEEFLKNYDPKNSKCILDIPYDILENSLNKMYSDDLLYYEWLNSNKDPFYIKINCYIDYLLKDNKKDAAEFFYAKKKQKDGFEERLKKKLDKKRDQQIEKRLEGLTKKLNSRMLHEMEKINNEARKSIEKKYNTLFAKEKEKIKKYYEVKYQKKYENEISRIVPNNTKSITHMIKSFHDNKGNLDLNLLLLEQRIENNRLLCHNVKTSVLNIFLYLYITRFLIRQIPKNEPDYKRLAKKIKKTIPEFVIS